MDFFSRLFGKASGKDSKPPVVKQLHTRSAKEVRADNSLVSVYGAGGREVFLKRDEWESDILPHNLKKKWDNPDELCQLILTAMRDNLYKEILDGARQLYETDPSVERGTVLYALALVETGHLKDAVTAITGTIDSHGESGPLLCILARAYSAQGNVEETRKVLWRALENDPNQANSVEWWAAMALEESGSSGYKSALNDILQIKGAWRPQLWLGRLALANNKHEEAVACYRDVIKRLSNTVVPADVATQISGDLGKAGQMEEIVNLFGSPFNAELWGILTGNNLVSAYCSLGELEAAEAVVQELSALNHAQWDGHVDYMNGLIRDYKKVT